MLPSKKKNKTYNASARKFQPIEEKSGSGPPEKRNFLQSQISVRCLTEQ